MTEEIKVCVDKVIEGNEPAQYMDTSLSAEKMSKLSEAPRMAILRFKAWTPGRTLNVSFLDGNPVVQEKVISYAKEWTKYANIKFEFVQANNADIRVSFKEKGSWSHIGRDALAVPKNKPTVNFGWLTPTTEDDEYSRVVIHEFGHALGCVHEHQNPSGKIKWNKPVVYEYFEGPPNKWTKEEIDHNLFERYSKNITNYTKLDPESIMLYPVPAQFTLDNKAIGGDNKALSVTDKKFIAIQYPQIKV
jgi:Astacin (Peptidase family M12A)